MGKALIVGGGEDGQYSVEVLYNRERIDAELEYLAGLIAELIAERDALQAEYDQAEIERNAAVAAVDQKIAEHIASGADGAPNVEAELVALANASAKVQMIDVNLTMVKGRILQAQKRQDALNAIPANDLQPVWCADLSEEIEGEVGTIEIPGEGRTRMIIQPAFRQSGPATPATWNDTRDGQLHFREGQVGYQAYFNAAILPGWQKWKPTYRIGTITAVDTDTDTCTLDIQSEDSSAQDLLIDPPGNTLTMTDVPILYMDCNSVVFEAGDRVVVQLQNQDWEQPRVIGFEKEPKPCCRFIGALHIHLVLDRTNTQAFFEAFDTWYKARALDLERCFRVQISVSQQYPRGCLTHDSSTPSPAVVDWTQWWYQPQSPARGGILLDDFSDPLQFPRANWGAQFDSIYAHTQPALMFWFRGSASGTPEPVLTPHPDSDFYEKGFYTNSPANAAELMLPNASTKPFVDVFFSGNAEGRDKALFIAFMPESTQDDLTASGAVSQWAEYIEDTWADTHWVQYSATLSTACRVRAFPDSGHSNPPVRADYPTYNPTHSTYALPVGTGTDVATGPADVAKLIEVIEAELKARKMYVGPDPE